MEKVNLMLAVVAVVVSVFASNANAVLFDFDGAPYLGGLPVGSLAGAVEDYMEQIYGSDITVEAGNPISGIVGNGLFNGPLGLDEAGNDDDHYIQAGPSCDSHWFSFSFNEVPIIAVSFDWGARIDAFHAYADGEMVFSSVAWDFWTSGNSGTIYFDSPVTVLKFTDSFIGEIEVDNLCVTSIPEPATVCLLGLSGLILLGKRKR